MLDEKALREALRIFIKESLKLRKKIQSLIKEVQAKVTIDKEDFQRAMEIFLEEVEKVEGNPQVKLFLTMLFNKWKQKSEKTPKYVA